jgi:hypothetical protein
MHIAMLAIHNSEHFFSCCLPRLIILVKKDLHRQTIHLLENQIKIPALGRGFFN